MERPRGITGQHGGAGAVGRAQTTTAGVGRRRQILLANGKLSGGFRQRSDTVRFGFRRLFWSVCRRAWKGKSGGGETSEEAAGVGKTEET